MQIIYKGFELEASREDSITGIELLFFGIYRISDGLEISAGFSYDESPVEDFLEYLKDTVDDFLENPTDYLDEGLG